MACEILWAHSGRQFSGVCADTVRPLRRVYDIGMETGPFWWSTQDWRWVWTQYDYGRPPERAGGCWALSEITLGAYPLREIVEVRINGAVVDPTTYRIDDRRWLVRIDPDQFGWPTCQDLSLNSLTDLDTFQVSFLWGDPPPVMGRVAAQIFAIELTKGRSGNPCNLPDRIQSFNVPGATYQFLDPMLFLDQGRTGIYIVDEFLAAVNPAKLHRRPMVVSPDFGAPVRRAGTTPGS